MKKLIALILLALIGFYVAWPAWSGYRIYTALNARDEATLASKIDFPSVRTSLRPTVSAQVERQLDEQLKQAGPGLGGMLGGDLKTQVLPRLVDGALNALVTPANVIRIANDGGDVAATIQKILNEHVGRVALPSGAGGGALPGGVGGLGNLGAIAKQFGLPGAPQMGNQAPAPATPPPAARAPSTGTPKLGFGNIKGFAFEGPLAMTASVARDAASPKPDLTAGIAFSGLDWKLTKLVPHL